MGEEFNRACAWPWRSLKKLSFQPLPVEGVTWADSFIAATHHLIDVLQNGGEPKLDGPTGKAVLQMALAAQISAKDGCEVDPESVP